MGFFRKLFEKNTEQKPVTESQPTATQSNPVADILIQQNQHFQELAAGKVPSEPLTEQYLINTFAKYFAPNKDFYMPGTDKSAAYFNAINAAKAEMIQDQSLFCEATKWTTQQLAELVNNPKPGVGNMMICGLIFQMGNFSVIKDAVYCVDFSIRVPNCIALYMLLIAQKLPKNKREMILDAGDGVDKRPLTKALDSLKICDPSWNCKIF